MEKATWIDLSHPVVPGMPVFPDDPEVKETVIRTVENDGYRLTVLETAMHAGTHLDAPRHFLKEGNDVTQIPLDKFAGRASVIRVLPQNGILPTAAIREAYSRMEAPAERLLLDAGWAPRWGTAEFFAGFPGFEPDFGRFLKEKGIVLFGSDLPSVKYGALDTSSAHRELLGNGVVIVENLVGLEKLPEAVFFAAFPLNLAGMDGSMVRAVARIGESGSFR